MKKYQNKEWLYEQYITLKKSAYQIAKENNYIQQTISRWLRRLGIQTRSHKEAGKNIFKDKKYYNKEWLKIQYINLKKSTTIIARECNTGSNVISHWLKEFHIPIRINLQFKKGYIPWNKGLTRETDSRVDKVAKMKEGIPRSEETKKKLSIAQKGNKRFFSEEHKKNLSLNIPKGKDHHNWKGGISSKRAIFNYSREWKKAWKIVYKRDNGICQCCNKITIISPDYNHSLFPNIHHIIGFKCKELRLVLSNLILVCKECHLWIHSKANLEKEFILKSTQKNIEKMIKTKRTGTLLEFQYAFT